MELDRAIATTTAIVEATKKLVGSWDIVANVGDRVPKETSAEQRYLVALGDLQQAIADIAHAAGIRLPDSRWATATELRHELAAEKPAVERAETKATFTLIDGGKTDG